VSGRRFFLGIALNASLWTLLATAAIVGLAFPDDPDAAGEWGLAWLASLPFVLGFSGLASLALPAYEDADSELLRFLLHTSLVLTAGLVSPFGWFVLVHLIALGRPA
jgi:hypothetical protein